MTDQTAAVGGRADPTTWAYKDGQRAALSGQQRDSNPCDLILEAVRAQQWFLGYDAARKGMPANPQTPPGELLAEALAKWKALPGDERNGERPFVMGFNEGWESALASLAAVDHCDDAHLLDAFYAAIPEKFCTDISGHRASVAAADPLSEDDLCWLRGIKAAIRLAHAKEQAAGVDQEAAVSAAYVAIYGPEMDPFQHPEGWEYAGAIADAILALAPAPASSVGEGDLRHKLRMVVSHATGGHLDLQDAPNLSVNDICVQISQHHNRVWEGGMEKGRASTLSTPDRAPAPADAALVEALRQKFDELREQAFLGRDDFPTLIVRWDDILAALRSPDDQKGGAA